MLCRSTWSNRVKRTNLSYNIFRELKHCFANSEKLQEKFIYAHITDFCHLHFYFSESWNIKKVWFPITVEIAQIC